MKFQATKISLLVSSLFLAAGAQAQSTTDVGTISVQGAPGGTDTGLIKQEETPKARSSVDRSYIDKQGTTANPYQLINLLPGVNSYGYDSSGLFGGGIRVRGFNSDQLGFTVDGVPVNDSGNYAVFPQEYIDQENSCEIFVTQGSTDTDAPHVGATGGNIGIVSCAPRDEIGGKFAQTFGSNALTKTFLRLDSGRFANDHAKFYISASHAEVDKFRGEGGAKRDHVDFKGRFDIAAGSYLEAGLIDNRALNNNYRTLTKAQIAATGKYTDFGTIAPIHLAPVTGTQQDERAAGNINVTDGLLLASTSSSINNGYYGLNVNPFKNYIANIKGHWQVSPTLSADLEPYLWYGYGTGGNELQTQRESQSPLTAAAQRGGGQVHGGVPNANGDGDSLDQITLYEGSLTKTYRPGATAKINWQLDNHRILLGYWYEKARHLQTAPYVRIDANGQPEDYFLANQDQYVRQADGQPAQFRDYLTVNTAKSPFIQDNIALFNDTVNVQLGVRHTSLERNFTNSASQGSGLGADYRITREYSKTLPNVGATWHFTPEQSVFVNGAKNFKAPANFTLAGLVTGGTFVNGVLRNFSLRDPAVTPEYSYNYDVGYRYAGDVVTASGSVFFVDYRNRIATQYNPDTATSTDFNVGRSKSKGVELEAAYKITKEVSLYSSLTYIKSTIKDNLRLGANLFLPNAGKEYPDTPNWLGGLNLQYASGPFYAFIQAKYTGKRYTTLVNDDSLKPYTLTDLGAGYQLPSTYFFKSPTIRANVFNLFSRDYLSLNSGSGSAFTNNAVALPGIAAAAPSFYVGQGISFSVSLSTLF